MTAVVAIAGLGSLVVAVAGTWLVAKNASRLRLIDVPNVRSSHEMSTPRGGGLGIVAGVAAGFLVLAISGIQLSQRLEVLLVGSGAIAAMGVVDDVRGLGVRYRFVGQILVAVAVVLSLGGVGRLPLPPPLDLPVGWFGIPIAVLWLVSVTNFFNFMDGIDGLAGGQAVASCLGIAVAAWSQGAVQFAFVLAASGLGFLVLNWAPAKIFLGDTGSTSIGFAIAGLPLLAPEHQRPIALLAVGIGLALFLFDPVETLVRLVRAGHRIGQAHRSHSYQILASSRSRHSVVAVGLLAAGLILSIAGGLAYRIPGLAWPAAILAVCAFGLEKYLAARSAGRAKATEGLR